MIRLLGRYFLGISFAAARVRSAAYANDNGMTLAFSV
jgi:hypothetical protein